jgi:predicted RNA-binding protein YlxR (DUF448 family)
VARDAGGGLAVDRTAPGRGAWLCADTWDVCLDLAVRRRAFQRAFRSDIAAEAVERLRQYP